MQSFRIVNTSQAQIALEIHQPAQLPENTPIWRRRRLVALITPQRYVIPQGGYVEIEFENIDKCRAQPMVKFLENVGKIRIDSVDELLQEASKPVESEEASPKSDKKLFYKKVEPEIEVVEEEAVTEVIDDGKVACQVCGQRFGKITAMHLKKHEMTLAEYKETYSQE